MGQPVHQHPGIQEKWKVFKEEFCATFVSNQLGVVDASKQEFILETIFVCFAVGVKSVVNKNGYDIIEHCGADACFHPWHVFDVLHFIPIIVDGVW